MSNNSVVSEAKFFFVERGRERYSAPGFQILNIPIRFGDVRAQCEKVSEIGPNLACFSPAKFF